VGGPLTTKSLVSGCFVAVAVAVKDHVNVNDHGELPRKVAFLDAN
jgi:hypothetical protein